MHDSRIDFEAIIMCGGGIMVGCLGLGWRGHPYSFGGKLLTVLKPCEELLIQTTPESCKIYYNTSL